MYKQNQEAEFLCLECPYPECVSKSEVRANCPFIQRELKKRKKKHRARGMTTVPTG